MDPHSEQRLARETAEVASRDTKDLSNAMIKYAIYTLVVSVEVPEGAVEDDGFIVPDKRDLGAVIRPPAIEFEAKYANVFYHTPHLAGQPYTGDPAKPKVALSTMARLAMVGVE